MGRHLAEVMMGVATNTVHDNEMSSLGVSDEGVETVRRIVTHWVPGTQCPVVRKVTRIDSSGPKLMLNVQVCSMGSTWKNEQDSLDKGWCQEFISSVIHGYGDEGGDPITQDADDWEIHWEK